MNSITIKIPKFDSEDKEFEMHTFNPEDVLKVSIYTPSSHNNGWYTHWNTNEKYRYAVIVEFRVNGFIVAGYKKYNEAKKVYEAMVKTIYEKKLESEDKKGAENNNQHLE